MTKLVLKTVLITVSAIILALAVAYLCFAVFSPKTLAKGWEAVGSYDLSLKYYEKQYGKTEDISDLSIVCVKADAEKDAARAVKYLKLLTENAKFSELCDFEDTDTASADYGFTAYEIYFGKYAISAFYNADITAAISVAKTATQNGYSKHNAFYVILSGVKTLTASDGQAIAAAVSEIKSGLTDGEQIGFADRDIARANGIV